MKVLVDREKCMNAGMCTQAAPEVFEMDDDGVLVVLREAVPEDQMLEVQDAVSCCPMDALRLAED